jgi:outer membrane protein assembly factor BamD
MEREMQQQYLQARDALPREIRTPVQAEEKQGRSIWSRMTFGLFD